MNQPTMRDLYRDLAFRKAFLEHADEYLQFLKTVNDGKPKPIA